MVKSQNHFRIFILFPLSRAIFHDFSRITMRTTAFLESIFVEIYFTFLIIKLKITFVLFHSVTFVKASACIHPNIS